MKTLTAIVILALATVGIVAPLSATPTLQTNDPIESIRQHYASINQGAPRYRRVKKEVRNVTKPDTLY